MPDGWTAGWTHVPILDFCQRKGVQARWPEYRIRTWDQYIHTYVARTHTPTYIHTIITYQFIEGGGGVMEGVQEPLEPKLDPPQLLHCKFILVASYMSMQLVCSSKNIWAELSYEFGASCLINLGRVGMGRVGFGPSCP